MQKVSNPKQTYEEAKTGVEKGIVSLKRSASQLKERALEVKEKAPGYLKEKGTAAKEKATEVAKATPGTVGLELIPILTSIITSPYKGSGLVSLGVE